MRYACWDYGAALSALYAYHVGGGQISHTGLENAGLNSLALAIGEYVGTLGKACALIGIEYAPITRAKGTWKDRNNQKKEVLNLAKSLSKHPAGLTKDNFTKHGLGGLLGKYGNSVFRLLKASSLVKSPTDMKKLPKVSMDNLKLRKAIIIKVIGRSENKPIRISDFRKFGVGVQMISARGGLLKFIQDAVPNFNPINLLQLPFGYWQNKSNRIKAVRWFVKEKAGNDPYRVIYDTFAKNGLGNLANLFGVSELLKEAGYSTDGRFEQGKWRDNPKNAGKAIKHLSKIGSPANSVHS